ncbi:MAG: restriction endonuclease subunit S, partial [Acetobacter sp.]|nr:restriction endonuclease subunit S [Acetobacter sp.]
KYDWDKSATDGGTIKRLYNADLENLKLKLPPLEAQEKIVSAIEACEKEILRLENEKESLHGKTDAILKQYLF